MRTRAPRSDESGLIALLVAFLAVVLFGVGALAIDLGNAYTRARSIQNQADFAALDVGDLLPATTPAAQLAVADRIAGYINQFGLQDDRPTGPVTYTGAQLLASGAVTIPSPKYDKVIVNAPDVQVNFGLGRLIGLSNIKVSRAATVQVKGLSDKVVAPLYAVQGCDYGSQVLKDAPNGLTPSTTPPLMFTGGSYDNSHIDVTGPVTTATQNQTPYPVIHLTGDFKQGSNLIDSVGFFRDTSGPTGPFYVPATTLANVTATSADVTVPASVLYDSGTWFLRVAISNSWSAATTAAVLLVGEAATPTCPAGSSGGNFGQLSFGDESNPNNDIAHIFEDGPNKDIVAYPQPPAITDGNCTALPAPAVIYDGVKDDANCVFTETGFKPDAATAGLVTDSTARLRVDTTPKCGSSRVPKISSSYMINNDYLSCFFTDSTTTIATIANSGYSGPAVLSPDIVKSPRFFFVPVFAQEPDTGHKAYKIVAFRPAFLTDQPTTATKSVGPAADNGITIGSNGKVQSLTFILFNEKALPPTLDAGPPTSPVYSFGPKIVTMVN